MTKKVRRPEQAKNVISFDLPSEDPVLEFNIRNSDGELVGAISDTVSSLHKLYMKTQIEELGEDPDYMPKYAANLSKEYGVSITADLAYRIADAVCTHFHAQKKS